MTLTTQTKWNKLRAQRVWLTRAETETEIVADYEDDKDDDDARTMSNAFLVYADTCHTPTHDVVPPSIPPRDCHIIIRARRTIGTPRPPTIYQQQQQQQKQQ